MSRGWTYLGWLLSVDLLLFASGLSAGALQAEGTKEEEEDYYHKWLTEDVVYIITPEEREVFSKLQTDAERDRFIEEFWRRRDSDPKTAINEFKEEHYRRIQYANEHFTAGLPGWKTDRGMVYIKFGPPDHIQDFPAGSTYVRAHHEGGGTTLVHPFQVWRYNYIEGVGTEVEIEFIDPHGGNLYRFARDAQEKDMLLFHPLGYTVAEQLIGGDKSERIITRQLGDLDEASDSLTGYTVRSRDMPMERLELQKRLEAPPVIQFHDLQKIVETRVHYDGIPIQVSDATFRLQKDRVTVLLSVAVPDAQLTFKPTVGGLSRATVELYGMISTVGNVKVYEFEDTLVRDKRAGEESLGSSLSSKSFTLPPGRYKLSVVVRDVNSGRLGTTEQGLIVPAPADALGSSPIVLAQRIIEGATEEEAGPTLLGGRYKLVLNADGAFSPGQMVNFYVELYGFGVDQSTGQPALNVDVKVSQNGRPVPDLDELLRSAQFKVDLLADRVVLLGRIPTQRLAPGGYRLEISAEDRIQGARQLVGTDFRIDG